VSLRAKQLEGDILSFLFTLRSEVYNFLSADLNLPPYVRRSRGHYTSYDDPNALCGVIFVRSKFMAKILFHFLKDLSRSEDTFSFLMPQYATTIGGSFEAVDDDGLVDMEAERRKQEESLRKFRMKESNLLVSNSLIEVGIDSVRYDLDLTISIQ
jgi:hypothetical protein